MRTTTWLGLGLVLQGCPARVTWDQSTLGDDVGDAVAAVFLARPGDDAAALAGPYAVGALFEVGFVKNNAPFDPRDFEVFVDQPEVVQLLGRRVEDDRTDLDLVAVDEGDAVIHVLNRRGAAAVPLELNVRFPDVMSMWLGIAEPVFNGQPIPLGSTLNLLPGADFELKIDLEDGELGPLVGQDTIFVRSGDRDLRRFRAEAIPAIDSNSRLALQAFEPTGGPVPVALWTTTARPEGVFLVDVRSLDEVTGLEVEIGSSTVRAVALAGADSILDAPLAWTHRNGETRRGDELNFEAGDPTPVTVCVQDTDVCADVEVPGQLVSVTNFGPGCGCAGAPGGRSGGLGAAIVLLAAARRRRSA